MKKCAVVVFFLFSLFACSWALFHPGMFRLHDYVHAARIGEVLRGLQSGHFPVRWSSNFGFGYGMPLFEFYAPLPYYTGAIFYWLGLNVVLSIKLLYILCSAVTFLGMYELGRRLFGKSGGVLSAVALTMAPYRAVNLFVRGALSEAWGIMALPWILLGIVQVVRGEKKGWLTLVIGLLALFLSHNITTLLFVPISILFGFGYWLIQHHDWKKLPKLIGSYVLAIGLGLFYLLPALLENNLTIVNGVFQGYFYYGNHFLLLRQFFEDKWGYGGSAPWPYNGISFFFGYGHFLGLGLSAVLLVIYFFSKLKQKSLKTTWKSLFFYMWILVLFAIGIFMTLKKSSFIWDHFSFMVAVQFPWRWLSVVSVMEALLIGYGTKFISSRFNRPIYAMVLSIILIVTTFRYFQPENFIDVTESFYYTDPQRIRHDMSRTLNDYIPMQMQFDSTTRELFPVDVPYFLEPSTKDKAAVLPKGTSTLVDDPQQKLVQTNFSNPTTLQFAVADFPGWNVYIDGVQVPKKVMPLGNIAAQVPQGEHQVGVLFTDSPVRWWSDVVSLGSLLVLAYVLIEVRPQAKKT